MGASRRLEKIKERMNFPGPSCNLLCEQMAATPEALREQMLVIRSQIGDESAFQELVQLYGPRLLLFTKRMLQSSPDAVADVMQEVWIAVYRALPRLQEASRFQSWAFRIARDRIYREYRRRKTAFHPADDSQLSEVSEPDELSAAVDREELDRCLNSISPEHREALVLRYFEEMSYEEIARVTGSSLGTVRSRIHYGRQALKKLWKGNAA